ncbi:hypothetical protein AB0395_48545 [Streptosporangium sp. NPDC051023]|uniref:hypothetical protein n=1 Tax=Streptosporangium sp. NPDC051023 TaxID=3155410 RepID=UPI00344B0EA3
MIASPPSPSVYVHPEAPIELHRGQRTGVFYLITGAPQLTSRQLIDVGRWLIQVGREDLEAAER